MSDPKPSTSKDAVEDLAKSLGEGLNLDKLDPIEPDEERNKLIDKINEILKKKKEIKEYETKKLNEFLLLSSDYNEKVDIYEIIKLFADREKEYYIGFCAAKNQYKIKDDFKKRFNLHKFEKNDKNIVEKANLMSSILIYECFASENGNVRKYLSNEKGGGRLLKETGNNIYICIYYDLKEEFKEKRKKLKFRDYLTPDKIENAVLSVIKSNQELINILNKRRMIVFGFARKKRFEERMKEYQGEAKNKKFNDKHWKSYEKLNESDFHKQILIKTGNFELENGTGN